MRQVTFPGCTVTWDPDKRLAVTRFEDGTEAHACPHETAEYRAHAEEKSTGDIDQYCWQHDLAHCVVGFSRTGRSEVLWNVAHGLPVDTPECEEEERAAQDFQRGFFLR